LRSAVSNAEQKSEHLDVDDWWFPEFSSTKVTAKRPAGAHGPAYRYQRRTSSITVVVERQKCEASALSRHSQFEIWLKVDS